MNIVFIGLIVMRLFIRWILSSVKVLQIISIVFEVFRQLFFCPWTSLSEASLKCEMGLQGF